MTAEETSIDAFLAVTAASQYQRQLREYAESLLRQRCTRPAWCLLGMYSDKPIARAALWALPDEPVPSDLVLIDADWDEDDLTGARAVLEGAQKLAAAFGAKELDHHVDNPPGPPQYQENESARIRLLTEAGYELQRDGLRWLYSSATAPERPPATSLNFRGLREVGEEAFVRAVADTYEGTRDSILNRHIKEQGLLEAARSDFRDYQEMDYLPEWWELGYTKDGALVGVVMAARNPSSPVIAYVGVVPGQRGRGFAAQLVGRGTERLLARDTNEIRGDCDRDNAAMAKAFRRAGYVQTARRRSYQRTLPV